MSLVSDMSHHLRTLEFPTVLTQLSRIVRVAKCSDFTSLIKSTLLAGDSSRPLVVSMIVLRTKLGEPNVRTYTRT